MLMMLLVKVILIPLEPLNINRIQPASQGMTRVTRILESVVPVGFSVRNTAVSYCSRRQST